MEPAIRIEKVDGMKIGEEGSEQEMSRNEVIHVTQKTSQLTEDIQREKRMEQFQSMMLTIVKQAVEENNQALGKEVGVQVGDRVLKEMNYLMREQDEAEEERFRKLDAAIRTHQKGRRFHREKKEKKEKETASRKLLEKDKSLNPNPTV